MKIILLIVNRSHCYARSFISILLIIQSLFVQAQTSGLLFSGKTPRTRLDLFSEKVITINDSISVSFELSIWETIGYGQIMALNTPGAVYSLAYMGRDGDHLSFIFNNLTRSHESLIIPVSADLISGKQWIMTSVSFNLKTQETRISIGDIEYKFANLSVTNPVKANVIFGSDTKSIVDVPLMAIRNISVKTRDPGKSFFFALNETGGNIAHEAGGRIKGRVTNGEWLINKQHFWERTTATRADYNAGICFVPGEGQIVIFGRDSVKRFDFAKHQWYDSAARLTNGNYCFSGEAVYNPVLNEFYFYNLGMDVSGSRPFFSIIDSSYNLKSFSEVPFSNPLHHHAYVFMPEDTSLYIFGGYGNFFYSNDLYRYDFHNHGWERLSVSGDTIFPRMHTIAGPSGKRDEFYIFGGVGNETGRQELGKRFFFDLFLININRQIKRCWSIEKPDSLFVPTRGIIADPGKECFYALCCFRSTQKTYLARFDLNSGHYQAVSDYIPYSTGSIHSSVYLFYDEIEKRFIAVSRENTDGQDYADISVYTLLAPPVAISPDENGSLSGSVVTPVRILIILLLATAFARYLIHRRKESSVDSSLRSGETFAEGDKGSDEVKSYGDLFHTSGDCVKSNAVFFFGGFCALDRNGVDITQRFGPKIRQMLVLAVISTVQEDQGITSQKLTQLIWPDKLSSAAKNIRGVTTNHLRNLLENFDNVELVYEANKLKIKTSGSFYCDFIKVHDLASFLISDSGFDENAAGELINIMRRGVLLPSFVDYEWFDKVRIEHDELFQNVLEKLLPHYYKKKLYRETIVISEVVFTFDKLNELALDYKVKSLTKIGKAAYAQTVYERFQKEYEAAYNEKYVKGCMD